MLGASEARGVLQRTSSQRSRRGDAPLRRASLQHPNIPQLSNSRTLIPLLAPRKPLDASQGGRRPRRTATRARDFLKIGFGASRVRRPQVLERLRETSFRMLYPQRCGHRRFGSLKATSPRQGAQAITRGPRVLPSGHYATAQSPEFGSAPRLCD